VGGQAEDTGESAVVLPDNGDRPRIARPLEYFGLGRTGTISETACVGQVDSRTQRWRDGARLGPRTTRSDRTPPCVAGSGTGYEVVSTLGGSVVAIIASSDLMSRSR
jgi:hypothetical protein